MHSSSTGFHRGRTIYNTHLFDMMIQELPETEDQDDRVIRAEAVEQEAGSDAESEAGVLESSVATMVVGPSLTVTTPVPPREQFDQPISPLQASVEETLEAVVESISATVLSAVALIVRASTRPVDTVKNMFDLISSALLLWLTQASDVLKNMTRDLVTTAVKKIASDRALRNSI